MKPQKVNVNEMNNFSIEITQCLNRHLAAENNHDIEAIMATYSASPVVTINGKAFSGVQDVRLFHEKFGFGGNGAFSDVTVTERKRHISGNVIIVEQSLSGKQTGKWQGILPTNRHFEIPVCTVYSFTQEAMLSAEDVYFDSTLILKCLGVEKIP